jgi:hypothetical protein
LDLPDAVAATVRDPRLFRVTDLERAYETREVRELLGFDFDASTGEIVGTIAPEEFIKGYKKLVTEIVEKKISSRATKNKAELLKHIRAWPSADKPNLKLKGSFSGSSIIARTTPAKLPFPLVIPTRKKQRAKTIGLVPPDFSCSTSYDKIQDVFRELKLADPTKQALTCCILTRTLAEMGLYEFIEKQGMASEVKPRSEQTPSLSELLEFLRNNPAILADRHLQRALPGLREQQTSNLNLLVHNLTFHADEQKARTLWRDFEKLLRRAFA